MILLCAFSKSYNSEREKYEKTGNLLPGVNNSRGVVATINGYQYVDKFEPYWWSVTSGLQIGLPVKGSQEILIDFRFVNGVTPMQYGNSYVGIPGIQGDIRTNSFRLGLGYSIAAFGKKVKKEIKK